MNLILLEKINKLNCDIQNSNEYKEYIIAKEELEKDESVIKLFIKKEKLIMEYEDNLKYLDRNDPKNISLQIEIKKVIDELNELEIVKNYKEKEKKINEIIDLINESVFKI